MRSCVVVSYESFARPKHHTQQIIQSINPSTSIKTPTHLVEDRLDVLLLQLLAPAPAPVLLGLLLEAGYDLVKGGQC